jgi:hypothetical protein
MFSPKSMSNLGRLTVIIDFSCLPQVQCEKTSIRVNIKFDRPFYGMVFSKGGLKGQLDSTFFGMLFGKVG